MVPPGLLAKLRPNLLAVLNRKASENEYNSLVAVAHALAFSFLRSKASAGKLNVPLIGLNVRDIAYDCIADLFQRDDSGACVQLMVYFEGLPLDELSDQALLSHMRRLVFSRVNQGLFLLYQEADPSLGKILRNIKLCIRALGNFDEVERFGESYIAPSSCDTLLHLCEPDMEVIRKELRMQLRGNERIPDLLARLSRYLRGQEEHSRLVPLVSIAQVFRSLFEEAPAESIQAEYVEQDVLVREAKETVKRICLEEYQKSYAKYVGKKKVTPELFDSYFKVIEQKLFEVVVNRDGNSFSLFEGIKSYFPNLSREEYRRRHKNILEYLARQTHQRVLKELQGK